MVYPPAKLDACCFATSFNHSKDGSEEITAGYARQLRPVGSVRFTSKELAPRGRLVE